MKEHEYWKDPWFKWWAIVYVVLMLVLLGTLIYKEALYNAQLVDKDTEIQSLRENLDKNFVYNADYYATKIDILTLKNKKIERMYEETYQIATNAVQRNVELMEEKLKKSLDNR